MRRASLLILIVLLISAAVYAQAPAAPAAPAVSPQTAAPKPTAPAVGGTGSTGGVAVVDFMKAVTANAEGTRASNRLQSEFAKRQNQLQAKQKEGQDAQTELQTKDKVLSDARKAELTKTIDRVQTDLTRMNDDYQKEMQDLQQQYLSPVANIVRTAMERYAAEKGYAVVFDISGETSNIVFHNPGVDITDEVIAKVDEETAKAPPAKPATGAPPATKPPATGAPAAPKPTTPAAPKPPDPTKKP